MVSDSVEWGAYLFGCEKTKKKLNSSACGAGSVDLGDGMYCDAPEVDHNFPDRLLRASENGVKPGGLACFLHINGCVYRLKSPV